MRALLDQDEAYSDLLSDFLDRAGSDRLTWVHDVVQDRYWEASKRLVEESAKTTSIAEQSVRLTFDGPKLISVDHARAQQARASRPADDDGPASGHGPRRYRRCAAGPWGVLTE